MFRLKKWRRGIGREGRWAEKRIMHGDIVGICNYGGGLFHPAADPLSAMVLEGIGITEMVARTMI